MTWHVYLLRCADGSLYAGITTDLARRVAEHNAADTGAKYTRARRPVSLAWSEGAPDRATASRREYALRKLPKEAKETLVSGACPRAPGADPDGTGIAAGLPILPPPAPGSRC